MLLKTEIVTPALVLDLDLFEANLVRMADAVKHSGKKLRPHAKAHKCVEISKRQVAAGASGICVATVPEAELMSKSGLTGLLLTSPLADPGKIARIVETGAMVVADHIKQVEWYEEAAGAANRTVEVLIDLDVGDHRTGASSPEQALNIARAVKRAPHLQLRGFQAYSVSGSHASGTERKRNSEHTFRIASSIRDAVAREGIRTDILSGGSTGTWEVDLALPELTELQAGTYCLMDLAYRRLGLTFGPALTVMATIVSANHERFVTVDAGFKAFATDRGYGAEAINMPGSEYRWGGDEFGFLDVAGCEHKPRLGERIEFIPPHCDPTVNLYDRIYACRKNQLEAIWPVMGRMSPAL